MKVKRRIDINKLALIVGFASFFAVKFGNEYVKKVLGVLLLLFSIGCLIYFIIKGIKPLIKMFTISTLIILFICLSMFTFDFIAIPIPLFFIAFIILIYNDDVKEQKKMKKSKKERNILIAILAIFQVIFIYGYYVKFIR